MDSTALARLYATVEAVVMTTRSVEVCRGASISPTLIPQITVSFYIMLTEMPIILRRRNGH